MSDEPQARLPPALVLAFYGAMAGLAYVVAWLFDVPSLWTITPVPPGPIPAWAALGAGVLVGLSAHGLGELARRRFAWAQSFYERFAEVLGSLTRTQVVVAAVASGLAEEMLFRGALLPVIGVWAQALVFGVIHLGPGKAFRVWPVYAAVMGLGLGWLYLLSGSLLPAVLAHFTVNYFGLSQLMREEPEPET